MVYVVERTSNTTLVIIFAAAFVWLLGVLGGQASLLSGALPTSLSPSAKPMPPIPPDDFLVRGPLLPRLTSIFPSPFSLLDATGGPYIRREDAVDLALLVSRHFGEADSKVPPVARFAPAYDVDRLLKTTRRGRDYKFMREMWVVELSGKFIPFGSFPPEAAAVGWEKLYVVIDATEGFVVRAEAYWR